MNNKLVNRMNTVGTVGKIITIIVIVLMIIASVAVAGVAVAASVMPGDTIAADVSVQTDVTLSGEVFGPVSSEIVNGVNQEAISGKDIGNGTVSVDADKADDSAVIHADVERLHMESGMIVLAIWVALITLISIIVCAFFFKALMQELSVAESPFTYAIADKMKRFAIVMIVTSVIASICKSIIGAILTMGHGFAFSLDFGPIITAVIIFILVVVFRYGAQLQKESDETL